MKKVLIVSALVVLCAVWAMPATAQVVTIDLDDLSPEEAAKVLAAKNLAENGPPPTQTATETAEEWVIFGERFAEVIITMCSRLGVEVNEFVKTPVGKIATIVILWKVVGVSLWSIIGGTLAWVVITMILLWSFRFFHMRARVENTDGDGNTTVEYVERYEFSSGDWAAGSAVLHCAFFVAITITCLAIVF